LRRKRCFNVYITWKTALRVWEIIDSGCAAKGCMVLGSSLDIGLMHMLWHIIFWSRLCPRTKQPVLRVDPASGRVLAEYASAKAAAAALGLSNSAIGGCCHGKVPSVDGHVFRFKDESVVSTTLNTRTVLCSIRRKV